MSWQNLSLQNHIFQVVLTSQSTSGLLGGKGASETILSFSEALLWELSRGVDACVWGGVHFHQLSHRCDETRGLVGVLPPRAGGCMS